MNGLRRLLEHLQDDAMTGRVNIGGLVSASVHLQGGGIYCAERRDQASLLVAMGEASLFTPEEWQRALRQPTCEKWRALVDDDEARLEALKHFARTYTAGVLQSLMEPDLGPLTFAANVAHPFGPLERWKLAELVVDAPSSPDDQQNPVEPQNDRREFLELLMEVSPLVRPMDA